MISTAPRVCVLMATFNGAPWIVDQINSILNQVAVQVQVFVADDSSSDQTVEIIRKIGATDGRISLISFEQKAGSASANFFRLMMAVNVADFDYVAFSDQDDIWLPEKLIRATASLQDGNCVGYSCATIAFWPDGREKVMGQNSRIREYDYLFEGAGQGCTFVLKRDFFVDFVGFLFANKEKLKNIHYHDWLVYAFARVKSLNWFFDAVPMLRYRQHALNDTGARGSLSGIFARFEKIKLGWYSRQLVSLIDILIADKGANPSLSAVRKNLFDNPSLTMRLRNSIWIVSNGRRRLLDRLVLSFSIIRGWI